MTLVTELHGVKDNQVATDFVGTETDVAGLPNGAVKETQKCIRITSPTALVNFFQVPFT